MSLWILVIEFINLVENYTMKYLIVFLFLGLVSCGDDASEIYDGLYREWYTNGQLEHEMNYKDGKRDGLQLAWHENGQLRYERNYKDHELLSKKCYDENGNKIIF